MKTVERDTYSDVALVLAWPEVTARGDERWYQWLKKAGIFRNLNFKVGHAAIILIESATGKALYYDFGRYITPRGYGRARGRQTDPRLALRTVCDVHHDAAGLPVLANLADFLAELESLNRYTHGDGHLYCSLAGNLSFRKARLSADWQCEAGSVIYSAFAAGNNNCSRFVEQVLKAGFPEDYVCKWNVDFPETFVASPISNVVNARPDHKVIRYFRGKIEELSMNRLQSARFFVSCISDNMFWGSSDTIPSDDGAGYTSEPLSRPFMVPENARWLGGIGEGAWHCLKEIDEKTVSLKRYSVHGEVDFESILTIASGNGPDLSASWQLEYDTHAGKATIRQNEMLFSYLDSQFSESIVHEISKPLSKVHYAS
jgi:hypothetical protein